MITFYNTATGAGVIPYIKFALIVFLVLYTLFGAVVVKQVKVMTDTLAVGFEKPVKFLAGLHFFGAVLALFLAIFLI